MKYGDTKHCATCKESYPIEEFPIVIRNKKEYRRSYCRACLKIAGRKLYHERYAVSTSTEQALAKSDRRVQRQKFFSHLAPLPNWAQPGPQA